MPDLKEILLNRNVAIPKDFETFKDIFRHFQGKQVGEIKGVMLLHIRGTKEALLG